MQIKDGILEDIGYELIGKAQEFAQEKGYKIDTISIGNLCQTNIDSLLEYSIRKIYHYESHLLYTINTYARIVTALAQELEPEILLIGATMEGRSMAPLIAAALKTGLTADCTELKMTKEGKLLQIRPAFGESVLAHIVTSTLPQMATVRPGIMIHAKKTGEQQTVICKRNWQEEGEGQIRVLSAETVKACIDIDIRKEKILIVLGAGVKNLADVEIFEYWAKTLGGTLACSRKLVERGWFQVDRQVGLSGNAVSAELMITIGVAGSVQFQAGIKQVKKIIAINTDPRAPILGVADTPILADLETLVEELKETICKK